MNRKYGDRARFLTLYIKEAHPEDEWQMESNAKDRDNVCYKQPRTTAERVAIANDFVKRFHYEIPMVVDPIENGANGLYAGWPERFYIVDEKGVIVYKGKPGPFGYHPEEVEAWLASRFPSDTAPMKSSRNSLRLLQRNTRIAALTASRM
jgi:iodothyronine deiodinase-like protein